MIDFLRLALRRRRVVLLPGRRWSRGALGRRGASATLAWALAPSSSAALAARLRGARRRSGWRSSLAARRRLSAARRSRGAARPREPVAAGACGRWRSARRASASRSGTSAGRVGGDALFHLARVRKLDAFGDLTCERSTSSRDGGLHPGLRVPALARLPRARREAVAASTRAVVVRTRRRVLAPLALARRLRGGLRASSARVAGGAAVLVAQVGARSRSRPGHGGAYTSLALPGDGGAAAARARGARALLRRASRGRRGGARVARRGRRSRSRSSTRPTRSSVCCRSRASSSRGALLARELTCAAGSSGSPRSLVPVGARRPVAAPDRRRDASSHDPSRAEQLRGARATTASSSTSARSTATGSRPRSLGRGGAIAVAALLLVPLAALAARRRWAALVLGGSLVVLALVLIPLLFIALLRRRVALAVAPRRRLPAVRVRLRRRARGARAPHRPVVAPVALAAGIVLQLLWPGDFGSTALEHGGPALATWIAAVGGGVALVVAAVLRRGREIDPGPRRGAGGGRLRPAGRRSHGRRQLEPARADRTRRSCRRGLVEALRDEVPEGRRRLRRPRDELPDRRRGARLRRRRAAGARRRHDEEPPVRAPRSTCCGSSRRATSRSRARYGAGYLVVPPSFPADGLQRLYGDRRYVLYRLSAANPSEYHRPGEGADRLALLPARRRRRRPAAAEVRDPPARARDRDARARARRPEVDPPRRRARVADAGVGAPRALPRPARPQARRGAARHATGSTRLQRQARLARRAGCSSRTRTCRGT